MHSNSKTPSRRIVIVGGGVSGLSIAVRLSQSGLPVTLLESGRLGHAASTKNQGWLYSGAWYAPRQRDLARLCHQSLEQTIRFCPDCLEPATLPMIYAISSPATVPSDWTHAWQAAGIPFKEVASGAAAEEMEVAESVVQHAFRLPDRAIRTDVLLECLTAKAEHQGVEIRTESPVTSLLRKDDQIVGVVTGRGEEIAARLVIVAANVGGSHLWPDGSTIGEQREFTRVGLKAHCLAIRPKLAGVPFCVVDLEGLNHIPHASVSAFGFNRWIPVRHAADQRVIPGEIDRLWKLLGQMYPDFRRDGSDVVEWAGTTVQAMRVDQVEPGIAPMPTVIDHDREPPRVSNLLSVFPGRASLWAELAEATRLVVLEKLHDGNPKTARPPWAIASS